MGVTDKVWDALTTVIKMNDKVASLAGTPAKPTWTGFQQSTNMFTNSRKT